MVKERKGEMSPGLCLKCKGCLGGVELSILICSHSKCMIEATYRQCYEGLVYCECQHGIG